MRKLQFIFSNLVILSAVSLAAGPSNTMLQFTMKAISKDAAYVAFPAQQETPLDVTEEALVTAIARARTAAFQLQLVIDRKETEMFPIILKGLSEADKAAKLAVFASHLRNSIDLFRAAEKQLITEHGKSDIASRDFQPLAQTLGALDKAIKAAHQIFHPQT